MNKILLTILLSALFFPCLAWAQSPRINVTMPDFLGMVEVSKIIPTQQLSQITHISKPNEMIGLYMPKDYLRTATGHRHDLPKDLIIVAIPKDNPSVPTDQFHLLKDALRPKLAISQAAIFADNPRWIGATRPYVTPISKRTFLFATAVISIRDRALMVQYLKETTRSADVKTLHDKVEKIVNHVISLNKQNAPISTDPQTTIQSRMPLPPGHHSSTSTPPSLYNKR